MVRRPPRSTLDRSSAASDVYKRQVFGIGIYHEDTKQIEFPATYENGVALPAYSNSIYDENRFAGLCFLSGNEIVMGDLETEYKKFLQNVPVPKQGHQPVSLIY